VCRHPLQSKPLILLPPVILVLLLLMIRLNEIQMLPSHRCPSTKLIETRRDPLRPHQRLPRSKIESFLFLNSGPKMNLLTSTFFLWFMILISHRTITVAALGDESSALCASETTAEIIAKEGSQIRTTKRRDSNRVSSTRGWQSKGSKLIIGKRSLLAHRDDTLLSLERCNPSRWNQKRDH
jgi:hypothetical protein